MGEVYRARDTRLQRDVAIKVLPESFAADPDRLARFQREAQVLASLNHPNIAAIHGFEEQSDVVSGFSRTIHALVLELVEGEALEERIARRPIPVDEALPIARQIAEALEAAHEAGFIHRDLKPANIKITPGGHVKVLDFGLAKMREPATVARGASQSPTVTTPAMMTGVGTILGTAAYMSPEQARGKPVDRRADIWAFGCVLFEMLAGMHAFRGETVSETLAEVMKSGPPWVALPPDTPATLRNVVRRCLEKDPRQRVRDIGDVRLALEGAFETAAAAGTTAIAVPRPHLWQRPLPLATAILMVSIVTGLAIWTLRRPASPQVVRWTMTPSGATALSTGFGGSELAISPDGTRLVYVGTNGTLLLRALDQLQPKTLLGLGGARTPFFSPDGQWIGFWDVANALRKVATTGGPPVTVAALGGTPGGASWGADGAIIFATQELSSGLLRVPADGGEPEVLTRPHRDGGESDHLFPEVLPGGQAALFTITTGGAIDNAQIAVLDLTTRQQKILIRGGSHARYVSSGHLVYDAAGALWAVGFDLRRLEAVGIPVPVLDGVIIGACACNVSISAGGTLVYISGGAQLGSPVGSLVWVDRQGREEALNVPVRAYRYPRLSPAGTKVAVEALDQERDIWIWDVARETLTRLTFDPAEVQYPVWTPDGRRVLFRSERSGSFNLFGQAADGTGTVERVTESPAEQAPYSVSPDGTRLVFREDVGATGQDLRVLTLQGERRVEPLVQTAFTERNGEISPDGRWLAYESSESGRDEIYVRPFPDANSGRWQISTGGGRTPLWARSGKERGTATPRDCVTSAPSGGRARRAVR